MHLWWCTHHLIYQQKIVTFLLSHHGSGAWGQLRCGSVPPQCSKADPKPPSPSSWCDWANTNQCQRWYEYSTLIFAIMCAWISINGHSIILIASVTIREPWPPGMGTRWCVVPQFSKCRTKGIRLLCFVKISHCSDSVELNGSWATHHGLWLICEFHVCFRCFKTSFRSRERACASVTQARAEFICLPAVQLLILSRGQSI